MKTLNEKKKSLYGYVSHNIKKISMLKMTSKWIFTRKRCLIPLNAAVLHPVLIHFLIEQAFYLQLWYTILNCKSKQLRNKKHFSNVYRDMDLVGHRIQSSEDFNTFRIFFSNEQCLFVIFKV